MNASPKYSPDSHADICLLLEGTYPYVRGGVSSWVKQIIQGMPNLKASKKKLWGRKSDKAALFDRNSELHDVLATAAKENTELPPEVVRDFTALVSGKDAITGSDLFHSEEAWNAIREKYIDAPEGLDFNHFFWTVRTMHGPLFTLANIVENAPSASMYHSVSTGYAGYLGSMLKHKTGTPYIITEHGIYTKEREIDLSHVDWIPEELDPFRVGLDDGMGYLRQTWIRFFRSLGRMAYSSADHVYTLYNGNRLRQLQDGASDSKLTIVPNGVSVENLKAVRRADDAPVPPVLALIGRIVPIKDIKTFIRTMRIVVARVPEAKGWLVGPEEEDPSYVAECKALVESYGLENSIEFLGFQKLTDIFPKIGLTVLTSVSEGQPLTTLEGFAAGIPTVTTDVGSCSELIYGVSDEDSAIGAAGAVVPIANPGAFAEAVIPLLTDEAQWRTARDAAITRVEKYYDEKDMVERYENIYLDLIANNQPMQQAGGQ